MTEVRTGRLLRDVVYLIWKTPGLPDTTYSAPEGAEIVWRAEDPTGYWERPGTNQGHEADYGGRLLHWIDIVGYGGVGAEEGVDFEFD